MVPGSARRLLQHRSEAPLAVDLDILLQVRYGAVGPIHADYPRLKARSVAGEKADAASSKSSLWIVNRVVNGMTFSK